MTRHFTAEEIATLCAEPGERPAHALYVVFVGFGHSGHSLIGALLDAHPNASIANELNVIKQTQRHGLSFDQAWQLTQATVASNQDQSSWTNTGYQYRVEGGFHGLVEDLALVGDKKGGGTARMIESHPEVWRRFVGQAGACLRVVCVLRHPLDMLAAAAYRRGIEPDQAALQRIIANAQSVLIARETVGPNYFYCLRHEDFLQDPQGQLRRLCQFLKLSTSEAYLATSTKQVRSEVNARRFATRWPPGLLDEIEQQLQQPALAELFSSYLPLRNKSRLT